MLRLYSVTPWVDIDLGNFAIAIGSYRNVASKLKLTQSDYQNDVLPGVSLKNYFAPKVWQISLGYANDQRGPFLPCPVSL